MGVIVLTVWFPSLVFRMVEAEEEYVEQLNLLVSCFLRPFKMAASSKKPPSSHEDVNSIFLNSETLLFLHQIFLKGLSARMESWPTLVLGECRGEEGAANTPATPGPAALPCVSVTHLSCFTMTAKSRLFCHLYLRLSFTSRVPGTCCHQLLSLFSLCVK